MKVEEVIKIKQTTDEAIVNDHLLKGFKIIKILSTKTTSDMGDEIKPTYIMGLNKEEK